MTSHTAVVYGSARRGHQGIKATRFPGEYEWYPNALKAARMKEACSTTTLLQQVLCRGDL